MNLVSRTLLLAALTGFPVTTLLHAQSVAFGRIAAEQKSPMAAVQCILQDKSGFMWFGTQDGLYRFDGYDLVAYKPDPGNSNSLSNDAITAVLADSSGTLWVATALGGLNRLDREAGTFSRFQHDPDDPLSLNNNSVRAMYEDRSGILWLGTVDGISTFDRRKERFPLYRHNSSAPNSLSHDSVRALYEDRGGVLWIGTLGGGLNRLVSDHDESRGATFSHYLHDPMDPRSISHNDVWALLEDSRGIRVGAVSRCWSTTSWTSRSWRAGP